MSYSEPTIPPEVPGELAALLDECNAETLRSIAKYADALAEYQEREERINETEDEETAQEHPEDMPEDVPTKATLTEKEINGNRYYYWQWREGDKIKSQYKGPVNPSE
ncbi:hypothetical protein [Natrialba asiatica]|uniref:DUF6788 domain-containing protein n=1 Tax=Natrialba asiatica (strain ATCC 700177 / DSM 12278 / JCM 9576 / FERM P-10747 / NBRC 102637 / 172P1) TaxID=29540 RepID=M0AG30_NATA1|nr:hypothetical protein [Natrialba asiatica]ELY97341.1 hypothetical protein C481_19841 [Natrialba asiatica DSM 12278]